MVSSDEGKIVFLYLELLKLSSAFAIFAKLFDSFLSNILGIGGLLDFLLYWSFYGILAAVLSYTV